MPAQAAQHVGPRRRQEVVAAQRTRGVEAVDQGQARLGSLGQGDGHGPVELDHRGGRHRGQGGIERGDLGPVGVRGGRRLRVQGRDGGLDLERPGAAQPQRGVEHRGPSAISAASQARAVLLVQQDEVAGVVDTLRPAGRRGTASGRAGPAPRARPA